MDTLKYVLKRLLISLLILVGVSIIIYALSRMMPADFVDNQYSSAVAQGTMQQEDVDRIKEIYGLAMPDAFLSVQIDGHEEFDGKKFTKNTKVSTYEDVQGNRKSQEEWYSGSYDWKEYRIYLDAESKKIDGETVYICTDYRIYRVESRGLAVTDDDSQENMSESDNQVITLDEVLTPVENGKYSVNEEGNLVLVREFSFEETENGLKQVENSATFNAAMIYRQASFWDKTGSVLSNYFIWLGNLCKGDLGVSFKYKKPVGTVIANNMGISFAIAFVATILQFAISIPLGIKAATNQYGVVDYTVTILTMIGISLPTFFLSAILINVFSVNLGWFPIDGLMGSHAVGTSWWVLAGDVLWHMILPMFVLVILSVGSLMRYTRTNTLEVLNADYIRTARAKGLSEKTVIYKHAFRNTMIPLVTLMASVLPSLFGGAMITETVFAIPGIGKLAYDALLVGDIPFIMGYNMFLAIMTIIGTLLSDLMYAVVDPRVKLGK